MYEIEMYQTQSGRAPVKEYMDKLAKESKEKELAQIILYKNRLAEYGMAVITPIQKQYENFMMMFMSCDRVQTVCSFFITPATSMCYYMLTGNMVKKRRLLKSTKQ